MIGFVHDTAPQRVIMGAALGAARSELDRLGATSVMTVASPRSRALPDALADASTDLAVLPWTEVVQHVPVELAQRARAAAAAAGIDTIVAVGGGSAIGLGKAVALELPVRIIAVPTTYAGSEATSVWGLTDAGGKRTGVENRVLPATVIYDPDLVASMPPELASASGLNAIAHCVDALWAPGADPINTALATEGLAGLYDGLLGSADRPHDRDAAARTQYGCYLAAVAFASAGSGMHHKICHVLGGTFNLPHAATHAVVLPYVLAWNAPAAPYAAARIATALHAEDAVAGLAELRDRLGAPRALRDLGLRESDLSIAVARALPVIPASNPRPVDEAGLTRVLHAAWAGDPAVDLIEEQS